VADRQEIVAFCDQLLSASLYQDVAVNGLQVEGAPEVTNLAVSVSTSIKVLHDAVSWGAHGLLVHHGLLWGARMQPLSGVFGNRLRILFKHDLNLIAYHLPLDGHETLGNCALLAESMGFDAVGRFAEIGGQPLGVIGQCDPPISLLELVSKVDTVTGRRPTVLSHSDADFRVRRAGFLTGSGYSALEDAVASGCDTLVTGDVREPTMAEARELGITVIAAGHEATERLGVQALASRISETFGVETRFFEDPNPV
jgi:dinuclear metal center YbgI/SA1388 family protein